MAKNMLNSGFRKLDVDAYNEDQYNDDDDNETPGIGPDENEVNGMLQTNRLNDALKSALKNPPLRTKNQIMNVVQRAKDIITGAAAAKDKAALLVTRVLCSYRQADIEAAIKPLARDELDVLMKYIYKGMELAADNNCASLLAWHDKVHAVAGNGCIVRVFTDRKRL